MITCAVLLEVSGLQQLHEQQSQESCKGTSSTATERGRIWGHTKCLVEWVSHSHQISIRNACFLSPLSQVRGLPLPQCPRHIHCHPWGGSTLCNKSLGHPQVYLPSAAVPGCGHCALCPPMSPLPSQMCHGVTQWKTEVSCVQCQPMVSADVWSPCPLDHPDYQS